MVITEDGILDKKDSWHDPGVAVTRDKRTVDEGGDWMRRNRVFCFPCQESNH